MAAAASGQRYLFGGVLIGHEAVASDDHSQRFAVWQMEYAGQLQAVCSK